MKLNENSKIEEEKKVREIIIQKMKEEYDDKQRNYNKIIENKKLASIYMQIGQYSNAKEVYERIIKQGSVAYETYYELALLCVKTDDTDRAEQILKKVCGLNPEFALAHKDLGVIYLNKRLFDYAKDEFEKAYSIAPNNYSVVVEYANYLHSTSDFEKADELYQKA